MRVKTQAQLQAEFDKGVPELAFAIKALIRGYLPRELRAKPFDVTITTTVAKPARTARKTKAKK